MVMQLNCGRVPETAQSIGLGDRFRYWRGASGRRYLFSRVNDIDLSDLSNVVLIVASVRANEPMPLWLGEVDSDGVKSGISIGPVSMPNRHNFVHFLAGTDAERRAVMLDLVCGQA